MIRFDAFLIRNLQQAYLWILDWTGIYVATIGTMAIIIGNGAIMISNSAGSIWLQFFFMTFNIMILIPYYLDQDKANYTIYNLRALMFQESVVRIFISYFFIGIAIAEFTILILHGYQGSLVNTIMLWLYINITSVCIREREPKEWFKKPKLAMEFKQ
jgi:hypothetical protein